MPFYLFTSIYYKFSSLLVAEKVVIGLYFQGNKIILYDADTYSFSILDII